MKKETRYRLLWVFYTPFQFVIMLCLSPIILFVIACARAEDQAFEDIYITKDNKMLNQNGPAMSRKVKHCWLARFVGLDRLKEELL